MGVRDPIPFKRRPRPITVDVSPTLGDKLQRLAAVRPLALKIIEHWVDHLLKGKPPAA